MKKLTTQQIVDKIADDYRAAGKALAHAAGHNGGANGSFMTQASMDANAAAIEGAYQEGNFENVSEADLEKLMEQYGASDLIHLTAAVFNATGKIVNVQ